MTLVPRSLIEAAYLGPGGSTDGERDGTEFCLTPRTGRAYFSVSTHSGSAGQTHGGPAIAGLRGLDQPVRLDIICRTTWWT